MIITVTLNPAIDKTANVSAPMRAGELNRLGKVIQDAGGKGINVSKTIRALDGKTLATGFLGKEGKEQITGCLDEMGIEHDFIMVDGAVRVNLKVVDPDGTLTELNEAGPSISPDQVQELLKKLETYATPENTIIFAGNVPAGVPKDIYRVATELMQKKGARVFLDADGDLFKEGIKACPYMIKPNEVEAAGYFGTNGKPDKETLVGFGKKFQEMGIKQIVISRGGDGAIFFKGKEIISCRPLKVKVRSTVGAGDSMVAAMAYAMDMDLPFEESVKRAMAISAGTVTTEGTKPPTKELVAELMEHVEIERL